MASLSFSESPAFGEITINPPAVGLHQVQEMQFGARATRWGQMASWHLENVAQRDARGRAAGTGKTHVAAAVALVASKNLPEKDRLPGAVFIPRGIPRRDLSWKIESGNRNKVNRWISVD